MDNKLHLTIDGKDIILTTEQECALREQMRIIDAISVLDTFGCSNINELDAETLLQIGLDLEDAIFDDIGDIEYAVIEDYIQRGIVKFTDDDNNGLWRVEYGNDPRDVMSTKYMELGEAKDICSQYSECYNFASIVNNLGDRYGDE